MKSIKKILTALVLLCSFSVLIYAQSSEAEAIRRRQEAENLRRQQEQELNARRFLLDNIQRNNGINRRNSEFAALNKSLALSKTERELRNRLTAPEVEDLTLYAEFLRQPRTGIFRLFPDNNCFPNKVVYVDGKCKNVFPGTWLFSFREKDYSNKFIFDLWLKDGKFFTDGLLAQGILSKLGNFSLDNVNLKSTGAKFLVDFKPAENSAEVKKQYDQIGQGIESNGYKYSRSVEAELGEVYVLRVIAYRAQKKVLDKILENEAGFYYQIINQDDRKDLTIALRIINKGANGNLTIIWKELDEGKSPEIEYSGK